MRRSTWSWGGAAALLSLGGSWIGGDSIEGRARAANRSSIEEPSDPCNFATDDVVFSYEQVLSCYHRVPFEPDDRDNILQVIEQHRNFSDLAEIYDARVHWKDALAGLSQRDFPDDLALQTALVDEAKSFRNGHVSYTPPDCYSSMVLPFVPFDFGSALIQPRQEGALAAGAAEQIIFIEDLPLGPTLYADATGIDVAALVGQRVVSINGVPVLDYFRSFTRQQRGFVDDGGGLNGILQDLDYSLRFNLGAPLPDRAADTYVFESVSGVRQELTLPWLFVALLPSLEGDTLLLPTATTTEFLAWCRFDERPLEPAEAAELRRRERAFSDRDVLGEHQRQRQHVLDTLRSRELPQKTESAEPPRGYFEAPPEQVGQGIEQIIPLTGSAGVLQFGSDVTVLRLLNTSGWVDVARAGIAHACEHSQRLLIDLRSNGGGDDTVIRFLHHHLFPEQGLSVSGGLLPLRLRNDNPAFNELLFNVAAFHLAFPGSLPACSPFQYPACLLDVATGAPLDPTELAWFLEPSVEEVRGGTSVSLTRQIGLPVIDDPVFDVARCAGRFAGDDLILLTNGSNSSGGYFLPAVFKGDGVLVNTGGFAGEPMAMGRAHGGARSTTLWGAVARDIERLSEGVLTFEHEILSFTRPVAAAMEHMGAYAQDQVTLHLEAPIAADLHVDVWANVAGSEAFVYGQVLDAVDARQ